MPKNENKGKDSGCTEEQEALVKKAVRDTFHEMKRVEDELNRLQQVRSALKRDLVDLKDGRLDRIEHRQDIDIVSKEHSVFLVSQVVEIGGRNTSQWYFPYSVKFREDPLASETTINNSISKIHAGGACKLDDGEVKYL